MRTLAQNIETYIAQADILLKWIDGLTAEQCGAVPPVAGAGAWSMRQMVIHMLDSDLAATHRMRRMVAEEKPLLIAYDETAFCANAAICAADLGEVAALFAANRRFMGGFLRSLSGDAWGRTGVHNQRGIVTVEQMVDLYVHHAEHHERFARAKREAMGVRTAW